MAKPPRRPAEPDLGDDPELDGPDGMDAPEELESETGLDLSAADDLDGDHVPDDEESTRIQQAPD